MQKFLLPLLLVAVVAVAGCTGQTESGQVANEQPVPGSTTPDTVVSEDCTGKGTVREVNMIIGHQEYSPAGITVNLCDTVKISMISASGTLTHKHGLTINEYGINELASSEDPKNPVTFQFVADKYGSNGLFNYYCGTCKDGSYGTGHPSIQGLLTILK